MRRSLLQEWPLILGIVLGCFGMWWLGRAFVPMDWPAGFDWERYLRESWAYMHPGTMNSTWLEPLYSYVLGHLGDRFGWAWTGLVISSVASFMVVAGAGLLGRALSGPWVGAIAAISIPLTPQLAAASRWVNLYPILSGTTALGVACLAAFCRWPHWSWAVSGGVFSGLAWAIDGRTVTLLPGLVLLALTGALGVVSPLRRGVLLVVALLGLTLGPGTQNGLRVVPRESTAQVAEILRGIELSKLRNSPNPALKAACLDEPSQVIDLSGLLRPCAAELAKDNSKRVDEGLPFGLGLTLLCLPLALLPGRGGRRDSWVVCLAILPFVAMTLVMSRWIIVTPRYMMQIAAPAAVLVPLAVARIWQHLIQHRGRSRWSWAPMLGIGYWLANGGPGHVSKGPLESSSTYQMMAPVMSLIDEQLSSDDVLLDCSESHVEVAILPRTTHRWPPNHEGHDWPRCADWLKDPEGESDAYMIVGNRTQIPGLVGLRVPPPWQQVLQSNGQGQSIRVWKLSANFNREP